jgi:hypothetical protein
MPKIIIPDVKGKELYKFLIENKTALINQKKMLIKQTDAVSCKYSFLVVDGSGKIAEKSLKEITETESEGNKNYVDVKVIANTANWFDSQGDVLLTDSCKRSLKDRKGMIPHLHDHIHRIDEQVGDVQKIYTQEILLSELGINKPGSTQVLIFETRIRKDYNEKVYNLYKNGKVQQHSIGLQYVSGGIEMAINDSEYEKENLFWEKYINLVINRDEAEESGYMWIVSEYKLLENSAVLFGSNILTPTLETIQPGKADMEQENIIVPPSPSIVEYIRNTKFINL